MADIYANMNPDFVSRLRQLIAASNGAVRFRGGQAGFRTFAQQAALKKKKPHLAASAGHSQHEKGLAADIEGDLALAHKLAPQFGLYFPMDYEPWHIQPLSVGDDPDSHSPPPDGYTPPDKFSSNIRTLAGMFGVDIPAAETQQAPADNATATGTSAIVNAAKAAGFRGEALRIAVAIALAESGGRSVNSKPNRDGSIDRGPWQINARWHPEVTDEEAADPMTAAAAALRISSGGTNWRPWSTFKSGAYKQYLAQAEEMIA